MKEWEREDIDAATSWAGVTLTEKEQMNFMAKNPSIYREGKQWGFNDTVVREEILFKLEAKRDASKN